MPPALFAEEQPSSMEAPSAFTPLVRRAMGTDRAPRRKDPWMTRGVRKAADEHLPAMQAVKESLTCARYIRLEEVGSRVSPGIMFGRIICGPSFDAF
ncbi:hypothetical protein MRX96_041551 [Rhipicephalus microplus]